MSVDKCSLVKFTKQRLPTPNELLTYCRAVIKFGLTLAQFFYHKRRGGAIAAIFLSNVKRHPNKVAFRFQDESWTFQEVLIKYYV